MKTLEQSQDPLFIEENPFISYLYLSYAVYPHLTKAEQHVMESVWHRTGRFGINGSTELTFKNIDGGTMRSRHRGDTTDVFERGAKLPVNADLSERHFKRSRQKLVEMGVLRRDGHVSFYRISCYPSDFLDPEKHLTDALKDFDTGESYGVLKGISDAVAHLRKFQRL